MTQPRVVLIGAGIVGCALADELTARGWTDITVLEQGPLFATGGSSSHAPGLVFQTTGCKTMTSFARYTVEKYTALTMDDKWCFQQLGGLEVATTPERWTDIKRRHGWATSWGVESYLRDPEECARLHPLLDPSKILGGFHIPSDGIAKPLRAAEAQARRAMERGAKFLAHHKVTGIERNGRRVKAVVTEHDTFAADIVVSCVGMWGPRIGRMVDLDIPLVPMAHQYAKTAPLPALKGVNTELSEMSKPLLRHQDADLYFREHVDRIGIGAYGHRPMPISADDILDFDVAPTMPSEIAFTPEDFETSWDAAVDLLAGPRRLEGRGGRQRPVLLHPGRQPAARRTPGTAGLLGRRGRVDHALRRCREGDGRVAGGRAAGHRPARLRPQPVRGRPALTRLRARTQLPGVRRGLRRPAPAAARRTPATVAHQPVLRAAEGTRRGVPGGVGLGTSALVRGQRVAARGRGDPGTQRVGVPVLVADHAAPRPSSPASGSRCST